MSNLSDILFEKFEIVEVLKKNEHAGVYIAHHKYLGKKIVLKVLNTQTIGDDSVTERFKREAKTLAQLEHKNIIRVLDFGMFEEYFYISFEYFKSENLRTFIAKNNLTDEEREKLVIQLLQGLSFAHQNKIIHRDIKPENILVNENLELKLSDFGLALSASDAYLTKQHSLIGTPSYMSPEQIKGEKLTQKSDLFSAGIVIYELYKGENPFLGSGVNESINNIAALNDNEFKEKLTGLPSKIQEALQKIILRDPNDRCESAEVILKIFSSVNVDHQANEKPKAKSNAWIYITIVLIVGFSVAAILIINFESALDEGEAVNSSEQVEPEEKAMTAVLKNGSEKTDAFNEDEKTSEPPIQSVQKNDKNLVSENAAKIEFGELFVECIPWADVIIDGEKLETTPLKKNISLAEGSFRIKLVHPDFPIYEDEILIEKNEVTSVRVKLDTLFGFIDFNVLPWGKIYLNDKYFGDTPFLNPLNVLPGEYMLKISNPNLGTIEDKILIGRNDTINYSYKF
ncbi:MAG: serine/threonine protein kinase [Ignavibacteriae bacterium]|nr:serine/threonine protein kinase [Ignavibacteriota bacterium]NOG98895.1 serine/threonine protein kinase [Ignavibacteriota bacterium]